MCVICARADTCAPGYTLSSIDSASFMHSFGGGCGTNSGYTPTSIIRYEFAYPVPEHIRCGAGTRYENGACVQNAQGTCDTGFVDSGMNDSMTFLHTNAGNCFTGYGAISTNQEISYLTHRGTAVTKCAVGYYPTANGCTAYPTGNCPNNYYAVIPNSAYVRAGTDGTCGTNYSASADTDLCLKYMAPNIADMCTPQLACAGGATTLRTSTGVNLPLYGERATTPSINVGFVGGTVCHVNMVSGAANNTVNIKYNSETYHGVE